jgi:23S rRNA (uracil1939-C5)-methyltransferase
MAAVQGDLCPHYGECGGCTAQDVPYAAQVAAKAASLEAILAEHWHDPVPVVPSPILWHYRNKIDPAFARMRYEEKPPADFVKETVLGFKKRGQWYWPLDIDDCRIAPDGVPDLLAAVRAWYRAEGHRALDDRTGDGLLRHLLVRDAKRTGERMVVLLTAPGAMALDGFVHAVQSSFGAVSIQRGISTGSREVAYADEVHLLAGKSAIAESLIIPDPDGPRELHFQISPFSFFQTNPRATEALYSALRAWVRRVKPRNLYDLYGGMGSIAFTCSDLVEHVWSVESVESASIDGRANALANGIGNVTFLTQPVEKYLRVVRDGDGLAEDSAVILDPARAGLHPKATRWLMELRPEHLLYVSCNPAQLGRELPAFLEHYTLESAQGFDLFPHTKHVELVVAFKRK